MFTDSILENESIWIGGVDVATGPEREWVWFSTGEGITSFNWAPNEPNNEHGEEYFMSILWNGSSYSWHDNPSGYSRAFFCETSR
ncbi:PREDICTED: C-type lectin-like, partial [Priapulus caudatus]|uniref:C-type lectin-like n=1 Tax=Priapulus caudatus TaxID=37621 RepID=A0ABM1F0Z7_PRICU